MADPEAEKGKGAGDITSMVAAAYIGGLVLAPEVPKDRVTGQDTRLKGKASEAKSVLAIICSISTLNIFIMFTICFKEKRGRICNCI